MNTPIYDQPAANSAAVQSLHKPSQVSHCCALALCLSHCVRCVTQCPVRVCRLWSHCSHWDTLGSRAGALISLIRTKVSTEGTPFDQWRSVLTETSWRRSCRTGNRSRHPRDHRSEWTLFVFFPFERLVCFRSAAVLSSLRCRACGKQSVCLLSWFVGASLLGVT